MLHHWGLSLLLLVLVSSSGRGADLLGPAGASSGVPAGGQLVYNKEFMSGILHSFMSPKGVNVTRLLEAFNPAPCLQKCMPKLSVVLDSLGKPEGFQLGDPKDTAALCRQLESIDTCAATTDCDSALLDLAAKTYKFTCVDKLETIGDSVKCAQDAFAKSRADCETGCIVDRAPSLDPASLPLDVGSLCTSSVCLLGCMQKSLNSACAGRGSTPSLFNAILTTSTSRDDNTLSSLLSGMLPFECRDVLKAQNDLPERIASLASISQHTPLSVGKPKALPEAGSSSTTVTASTSRTTVPPTTTSTSTVAPAAVTTVAPEHAIMWAPEPVEARLDIDGETRTLQCRVLDWERRPVQSPSIDRLARLIAAQLVKHEDMEMRADDGEDKEMSFRRWLSTHDAESYKAIGFGAPTQHDSSVFPSLRANSESSSYPSWSNLLIAGLFPFIIYIVD